ncbi:uncharacterized protein RCC_09191 [Ramularia collo-cygni]|uniref:Uncharacterized protein n=1 Tax=Ramularia collo-cygni TaxID=112498 RepID=A0A2D3UZJ7_9PEZI|nr:uncharacterized protein RCC_09191 [Ramularia collo-cygni]CZT23477.1 uncharacterized protein RCC_09191 [Ramularia collo-cygni]
MSDSESPQHMSDPETIAQYGQDNTSDARESLDLIFPHLTHEESVPSTQHESSSNIIPSEIKQSPAIPIPIPQLSKGLVTFAYQRALLNRIKARDLQQGGKYDLNKYTPVFLHDILMLPGSLANLIGKGSPEDILNRMTPALLHNHHIHHTPSLSKSHLPSLLPSSPAAPSPPIQGMLLFGQGKHARQLIHTHYRADTNTGTTTAHTPSMPPPKRRKVPVEIEIMVPQPRERRRHSRDFWRPQRIVISVHAWKSTSAEEGNFQACEEREGGRCVAEWTLEGYLAGTLGREEGLSIGIQGRGEGDEDGDVRSMENGEVMMEYENVGS